MPLGSERKNDDIKERIKLLYVSEKQSSHAVLTNPTFAKTAQKQEQSFLMVSHNTAQTLCLSVAVH